MALSNYPQSNPLFGPPALVERRDQAACESLSSMVLPARRPTGVFKETWVDDIADTSWDVFQLRRVKAGPIASNQRRSLAEILTPRKATQGRDPLQTYFSGNPAAINEVGDARLRRVGRGRGHGEIVAVRSRW